LFNEQDLEPSEGSGVQSLEAGTDDPGVVQDEDIVGSQKTGELSELPVKQQSLGAIEDQEAGRIALGGGVLGDEVAGEWVIKIERPHGDWCKVLATSSQSQGDGWVGGDWGRGIRAEMGVGRSGTGLKRRRNG
jgi:hypothetical protein